MLKGYAADLAGKERERRTPGSLRRGGFGGGADLDSLPPRQLQADSPV